jgi:hypothetical protein
MYPKSVFPVTHVVLNSTYESYVHMTGLDSFSKKKKFKILTFYVIYLITVIIVILETHAKPHCLPMGS